MGVIQKNSFWNTVIGYAGVAVGFVSAVLLFPRLLSAEEVGLTNIFVSAGVILAQLSAVGGTNITLRYFPALRPAEGNYNGVFTLTLLISLVGTLFFTAAFLLFRPAITAYYAAESSLFARYCLFVIPVSVGTVFYNLFAAWLRSMMKVIASAVYMEIVLRVLKIAAVLAYAAGWISFDAFVCAFTGGFVLTALGLWLHCYRLGMISSNLRLTPRMRALLGPAVRYGIYCLFAGFGLTMVVQIDSMMLAGMDGLQSVAVYGIAVYCISALQMPYRAMVTAASPLVAQYWHQNTMRRMADLYRRFTLNMVVISLGLFLLVWVNIDFLYSLMPPLYAGGKWALAILFAGKFVDMATGLNATILNTSEKYRWDLRLAIVLVVLAVVTNSIFIPLWGIEGAALATAISVTAVNLGRVWIVRRYFRMQPFTLSNLWVLLLATGTWLVISLIPFAGHWLADLAMRSALVGLLFAWPLYGLHISDDFNAIADAVFSRAAKFIKGRG